MLALTAEREQMLHCKGWMEMEAPREMEWLMSTMLSPSDGVTIGDAFEYYPTLCYVLPGVPSSSVGLLP
jgi:hypothetical protein